MEPKGLVNLSDLAEDLELIEKTNAPLTGAIIKALRQKEIILGTTDNMKSSIVFMYAMNTGKTNIEKVFVNIARFSKLTKTVDFRTGDMTNKVEIIGGHKVLYDILLSAYAGLHAQRVFNSPTAVKEIKDIYVDIISRIISMRFGNPGDGEKLRFLISYFFFNGDVSIQDLALSSSFRMGEVAALCTKYPILNQRGPILLSDFLGLLGEEFPSLAKKNITKPVNFILETVSSIGDNAVYILDNQPYLLSVLVSRARKSKLFPGYMLKDIESDAGTLLTAILRAIA